MPTAKKKTAEHLTSITREAREPAERAITALREVLVADPFVFEALRDLIGSDEFVHLPRCTRDEMHTVRQVADLLKRKALAQVLEASRRPEVH